MSVKALEPSRMSFVHLLHGMLDGTVVGLSLVPITGHHGKIEGWSVDFVVWEHGLILELRGGDNSGVMCSGEDLREIISIEGVWFESTALTPTKREAPARTTDKIETRMLKISSAFAGSRKVGGWLR